MIRFVILLLAFAFISKCAYAETIYCPLDKRPLYEYDGEIRVSSLLKSEDFKPYDGVPTPKEYDELKCPFDGAPLNGWEFWFWVRKLPLPSFAYPAVTLMIKQDGEFTFFPDKVELVDAPEYRPMAR